MGVFIRPKNYCKYWKICSDFKRSKCEDSERNVKDCGKYKEKEDEKAKEKKL